MADDARPDDALPDDHADLQALIAMAFAEGDPPPPSVTRRTAFSRWAAPDADIAVLLEGAELAPTRGPGAMVDEVTFEFGGGGLHIDVVAGDEVTVGGISPWTGGSAWFEYDAGETVAQVDEYGEFTADALPAGPVRMQVVTEHGQLITDWFIVIRTRTS